MKNLTTFLLSSYHELLLGSNESLLGVLINCKMVSLLNTPGYLGLSFMLMGKIDLHIQSYNESEGMFFLGLRGLGASSRVNSVTLWLIS